MSSALLKAIGIIGSRRRLAKAIGTTPEVINGWLNCGIQVPLQYAFEIQCVTSGEVAWTEISPKHAHYKKRWAGFSILTDSHTIQVRHVALSCIKHQSSTKPLPQTLYALFEDIKQNGLMHPICISTDYELIFGAKRLHVYESLGKKTIPAWGISLVDLMSDMYSRAQLCQIFTLSERILIGLTIEKLLGNRQGRPKNNLIRENFPEIKGRTDELIAEILNVGNRKTYQQAKKICQWGCQELIETLDQQQIAISSAALLAQLPKNQQKQILTYSSKEIASTISQLRSDRQSHSVSNYPTIKEA
ncbi:YdaS family helix-turn-helix protein [Legionella sp.]|uniref:YdaS family helix-turn-helix protein n=1 Tax=Legionella sp. TaxID=459 RepID=UPI00321F8BB2